MDVSELTKRDVLSSSTEFTWRIQSFSAFSKLELDKHYSGVFSAGSFNWRLLVYPKGNNVEGYLSLYLELVDSASSLLSSSGCSEIYVDYTLSLLDQITCCKRRIISGTQERLNDKRSSFGFNYFVPLDNFNDPSKGYLEDDTCVFQAKLTIQAEGADCSTNSIGGSCICLTLEEAIPTKFMWKIDGFSKLDANIKCHKKVFTAGNYKWEVRLYPKGNGEADYLSLFLGVAESANLSLGWEVYADYSLSLVDQIHRNDKVFESHHWFNAKEDDWGWNKYLLLTDFNDPTKGFLINDTCIIEAKVSIPIVNYCTFEPEEQRSCANRWLAKVWDSPVCKFSWTIDKFSELNTHEIQSEIFTSEGYKWRLILFPRGEDVDQLSLYLEVVESETLPSGWRINAQFTLTVVNVGNDALTSTRDSWHQFFSKERRWGFLKFMPLAALFDKSRGYLANDKLQVETEVSVHRPLDYWIYDARKVTGYVGLDGSNSCLNSYLQILYHIPLFQKAVLHVPASESYEPPLNIITAMRHLFHKLKNNGICVSPNHFNRLFGYKPDGSCMWRDMHELIRTLFRELEGEIQGAVIEDQVKQLFAGEFTKFSANRKWKQRKSFFDLLLDVKGCRDVYSSFDLILRKGMLDDDSKYTVNQHTLQDAIGGGLFFKFPQVLQLVLKRFVFDPVQNTPVKIDDLYSFPFQLDLDRENGKYLSSDTVRMNCNLYTLHSIVVHKGSLRDGHFYCLIRPNLSDQWLKFENGRVTKEDMHVVSENLCGDEGEATCSNVCMLVYIRKCDKELIFSSDAEVVYSKPASLGKGRRESECKERKRSDESMYRIIKVSRDEDFTYQIGKNIYFDLVDHENVCSFRVRNDMPFLQFKEEVAGEFGIAIQFQRFWLWSMHPNETCRPYRLLTPQDELQSIGMLGEMANVLVELNLFLDVELGPDSIPIPPLDKSEEDILTNVLMELNLVLDVELGPDSIPVPPLDKSVEDILIFFKLYDPRIEHLRYVGRLYVKASDKPVDILVKLNEMAGLPANEEIDLFKEVGFEPTAICKRVDKERTFRDNMLKDGSILCYQSTLPIEERNRCLHPDVHTFLNFVREHPMWDKKRCDKIRDQRDALLFHAHKMISDLTNGAGGSCR